MGGRVTCCMAGQKSCVLKVGRTRKDREAAKARQERLLVFLPRSLDIPFPYRAIQPAPGKLPGSTQRGLWEGLLNLADFHPCQLLVSCHISPLDSCVFCPHCINRCPSFPSQTQFQDEQMGGPGHGHEFQVVFSTVGLPHFFYSGNPSHYNLTSS